MSARKPTSMKILAGNPGHRRLSATEPRPEVAVPSCPPNLEGKARAEWKRITQELAALGVLAKVDRAALAAYCSAWGTYVEADTGLKKTGLIIKTKSGNVINSPYLGIRNTAMKLLAKLAVEFGLTPVSRSRVSIELPREEDSYEKFLRHTA